MPITIDPVLVRYAAAACGFVEIVRARSAHGAVNATTAVIRCSVSAAVCALLNRSSSEIEAPSEPITAPT